VIDPVGTLAGARGPAAPAAGPPPAPGASVLEDSALPGLRRLQQDELRRAVMADVLRQWLGPQAELLESRAVPCRYVPGKRCSFAIDLTLAPASDAPPERRRVVAKVYARDHGANVYEMLRALRSHGMADGGFLVPEPIAYDPRWKLLFLSYAEGAVLRSLVLEGSDPLRRMEEAAHWLSAFHRCRVTTGRSFTFDDHVASLASERQRMAAVYPEADRRLERMLHRFAEGGAAVSGWTPGPTHRDFSPDHLVCDGPRLTAIDFDECRQYDPMFDVAHFWAHLRLLGLRHGGDTSRFDRLGEAFVAAYRAVSPEFSEGRVRFYRAIAFFKLAHIVAVVVRPPGWQDATDEFLSGAEQILEQHS
jgi:aminoglycoside phosphotransferase (APT) family kinase protein